MKTLKAAFFAAAFAFAGTAHAAIMDVTGTSTGAGFTSFATPGQPGVHGLEIRGGDSGGRATWEIGLGTQTSTSGANFNQAQQDWGSKTAPMLFDFEYVYGGGSADFFLWSGGAKPAAPKLSFSTGMLNGNAIEIATKRLAKINLTEIDGHAVNYVLGSVDAEAFDRLILSGSSLSDGFTLKGTMQVVGGKNAANSIVVKTGTVAAVPLPAALPLLAAGLGGMVLLRRRAA